MLEILQTGLYRKFFPGNELLIIISVVAVFVIGYLLGSLNFGIIISKLFYKEDIRKYGSKGTGMTNMLRIYGKKPAALTLAGDALKAAVAVLIGALLLGDHVNGYAITGTYLGGFAAILGHAFPVYYGFRGGKSIAATAGMIICTDPIVFIIIFAIFVCIVAGTKFLSVGSIMGIMIYPLVLYRMTGAGFHTLVAMVVMLLVLFLHRENIKRLMSGKESKFSLGKKGEREETKDTIV